jgi:hypothetical protein
MERAVMSLRIGPGLCLVAALLQYACGPVGRMHSGGEPVTWSIGSSDSPTGASSLVCEGGESRPCVLSRSTDDRPSYATFTIHLWGPAPTRFVGTMFVGYLQDPDPRRYKSDVDLTSNGQDVHQRVFSRVSSVAGEYEARFHLEETGAHLAAPRVHDVTVPVTVR